MRNSSSSALFQLLPSLFLGLGAALHGCEILFYGRFVFLVLALRLIQRCLCFFHRGHALLAGFSRGSLFLFALLCALLPLFFERCRSTALRLIIRLARFGSFCLFGLSSVCLADRAKLRSAGPRLRKGSLEPTGRRRTDAGLCHRGEMILLRPTLCAKPDGNRLLLAPTLRSAALH